MSWHTKTVSHEDLERELNAFSEQGFNVFQVLPVSTTHACIVSTDRMPTESELEKYYGVKPKKGKKS